MRLCMNGMLLTSAYGAFSSRVKPGSLAAVAYCATLDDKPILPQSYFWVVGMILKTAVMSTQESYQKEGYVCGYMVGLIVVDWTL